jgi:predicted nucleic acid-binding protein
VILVDTSAWVEYLRATGSPAHVTLRRLVAEAGPVATTDAVLLELLSGATSERAAADLRDMLLHFPSLSTRAPSDFEDAAAVARTCRRGGDTPRSQLDCLITAVALRNDAEVLHRDRDFDMIARHTTLRIYGA